MFDLVFHRSVKKALNALPDEDFNRCIAAISLLRENPFPGVGGDKEKLKGKPDRYRLHIGRTYSVIYYIDKGVHIVYVGSFGTIGDIHKRY